jgi:colanic acid/amylovoran biosynthesis protein
VPTVSIAYSIKAKGLNRDLFGDERLVLETNRVSTLTLQEYFDKLRAGGADIQALLNARIPEWKERARVSAQKIDLVLGVPGT